MPEWAIIIGRRVRLFYDYVQAIRVYNTLPAPAELWHLIGEKWDSIAWKQKQK